jgi:hypothetical protein
MVAAEKGLERPDEKEIINAKRTNQELSSDSVREQPPFRRGIAGGIDTARKQKLNKLPAYLA